MKGVVSLGGDKISSRGSLASSVESGESLQAEIRSRSGGQVRAEITSAIEVGWLSLGVGIGDEIKGGEWRTSVPSKRAQARAKKERKEE